MAVTLKQIQKLKTQVDEKRAERDKAKGREESLLEQLEEDFGCTSLTDAKKLLKKKQKQLARLEKETQTMYDEFMEEHRDELDEEDTK